jgi:hypothetical protein
VQCLPRVVGVADSNKLFVLTGGGEGRGDFQALVILESHVIKGGNRSASISPTQMLRGSDSDGSPSFAMYGHHGSRLCEKSWGSRTWWRDIDAKRGRGWLVME